MPIFVVGCYVYYFLAGIMSGFGQRKYQEIKPSGKNTYNFYSTITAIVSVINLGIMTGFSPKIDNFVTVITALVYAIVCYLNYGVTLRALERNGVFLTSITTKIGTIVLPMLVSGLVLRESVSLFTVGGAVCAIAASLVLVYGKGGAKPDIYLLCSTVLFAAITVICTKIFVKYCGSEHIVSYCFLINVIILIISVVMLFINADKKHLRAEFSCFKPKHYALVVPIAVLSNLSSYVSKYVLAHVEVITDTVITTAVAMLSTVLVARFFGEKFGVRHFVSIIFALAAAILPIAFV